MGVIIPQVVTEDKAGGAQVIDGGLRFDSRKSQRLTRTPSSAGNRKTWTWSAWVKTIPSAFSAANHKNLFSVDGGGADATRMHMFIGNASDKLQHDLHASSPRISSSVYRDVSGWYHVVVKFDSTQSTARNQIAWYINGQQIVNWDTESTITQNNDFGINGAYLHAIGSNLAAGPGQFFDGLMSQVYLIDGQALDPSYFGYTDPLTNTWRPKKAKITLGSVWSNYFTGVGIIDDGALTNVFDGNIATEFEFNSTGGNGVFRPPNPISYSTSIEVYSARTTTMNVSLNGGSNVAYGNGWTTISSGSGTLTYLTFSNGNAGNQKLGAIRVDGTILTNTSGAIDAGTNGFYLPLDGNTPIGQDQSGRGNNWTPVNFGGSNTLEKATGALPILNTDGGGKVARVGVRTDSNASSLVLALPLVGIKSDFSNAINSGTTEKVVTNSGVTFASPGVDTFYGTYGYFVQSQSDYLEAASTTDFAFGTGDFTLEARIYAVSLPGTNNRIITSGTGSAGDRSNFQLMVGSAGYLEFDNTSTYQSATGLITTGRWYHVAATKSSGTLRLFIDGVIVKEQADSYNVTENGGVTVGREATQSSYWNGYISDVRIYKGLAKYTQNFIPASTDPDILPDTPSGVAYSSNVALVPSTDGAVGFDGSGDYLSLADSDDWNLGSTWTIEGFIYVTTDDVYNTIVAQASAGNNYYISYAGTNNNLEWYNYNGGATLNSATNSISLNKWHHIALVNNGGTGQFYIDGVASGSSGSVGTISNSSDELRIGIQGSTHPFDGFISNLHIVKGTALYTSNFTPPTAPISSVANTKLLCCKSNSSATASDVTPGTITANGNAAASNFNPFTVNINTQRGQESGYATLSPLIPNGSTFSNGNLSSAGASAAWCKASSDFEYPSSGKWYWEGVITGTGAQSHAIGIAALTAATSVADLTTGTSYYAVVNNTGTTVNKVSNGTATSLGTIGSFVQGDVFGVAFDGATKNIWIHKNGIYFSGADPSGGTALLTGTGNLYPTVWGYNTSGKWDVNFGQKPFKFPPPAGFQPLALANTPRPTIVRPDQYVGIITYTGTTANPVSIKSTNFTFKPDFVWVKSRSNGESHALYDTVRGATYRLKSDTTGAETTGANELQSFIPGGFTAGNNGHIYYDGYTYVAWCWKAGGNSNTFNINDIGYSTASAAGLTAGTITPTGASVNTKSGFSIIGYTGNATSGATVSHGLGTTPAMVIIKSRSLGTNWYVWHQKLTQPDYQLYLNLTDAQDNFGITALNDKAPTSTVFELPGTGYGSNNSAATYVAYSWAEIPGFSKFGTYTGNGSTDGPMVVTGFRPRWILTKGSSYSEFWTIIDTGRDTYNPAKSNLWANSSLAENTSTTGMDILSNGFKPRTSANYNNSGETYIYAAFAESPTFNLYGAQSNAR